MGYNRVGLLWGTSGANQLLFTLDDPESNEDYTLESISGLEPPPIDVIIGNKVTEGGIFQGRRAQNRQIVMLLGFRPTYAEGDPTLGDLRKALYTMLSGRLQYVTKFYLYDTTTTLPDAYVEGYISRIEANPFSKDPQVQITMDCVSPYFTLPTFTHSSPSSLDGDQPIVVDNTGDAFAGFDITLKLTANQSIIRFFGPNNQMIRLDYAFLTNDLLRINTIPGQRAVTRTRSAVDLNLLHNLHVTSTWFPLDPGSNNLYVYNGTVAITAFEVEIFICRPRLWGI